jgi:hypothetical protein
VRTPVEQAVSAAGARLLTALDDLLARLDRYGHVHDFDDAARELAEAPAEDVAASVPEEPRADH